MKIAVLSIVCLCLIGNIFGQDTKTTNIKFVSGKNTLYGQISFPKNVKKPPLIVFLPGSNDSSYQTNYKKFLERTIEATFQNDFAILNFNKPGLGQSTGEWWNQDFYQQAENAINAVRYAKRNFPIDKSKIGIVGHSQGGWLAQIVAAKYPNELTFGISMAGPAVSVLEQFVESENSSNLCQGLDSASAKEKAIQNAYAEWLRSDQYGVTKKDLLHFKIIKGYDPRPEIKNIKIPFLFLFNEKDEYVYPTESLESIKNIFGDQIPSNIKTVVILGTEHGFRVVEKCYTGSKKDLKQSELLNPQMRNWINEVLKR